MQAIGIWYTPGMMRDFSMVREQIDKAKAANFDILIAFFRWMHINFMHPEAIETVARSVEYAHKLGMKYSIDSDPTWWQTDFTEKCPDAAMRYITRAETRAAGGRFSVHVPVPGIAIKHVQEIFDRVVAVFVKDGSGEYRSVDPSECDIRMEVGRAWAGMGDTSDVTPYCRLSGKVPGGGNRDVVLYAAFKEFSYVDFAHPAFLAESKRLLDMYAHIPLDGVGWDEPGRFGWWQRGYRAGNGFLKFFEEYKGYDLVPNLIHLDEPIDEAQGTRVRNDYYDALAEMNVRAQADHYDYARKLFGEDILLGTHQTWIPLGDIAIGYGDYFRAGKVLNPVWVDVFTRHEEHTDSFHDMLHVYTLGDSLRKEYGHRQVFSNDYFQPIQPDQIGFFTRMKMLFDVSWFYLWVGEHTEYMPNLDDRHAPEIAEAAKRLNAFQEFMGDDYRTQSDTAVLQSPIGLFAFPRVNYGLPSQNLLQMRYHLVRHFLREGRCFDYVGGCSLERADVGDGVFRIDGRTYSRLVLTWAACLPGDLRALVGRMAEKGVQVIYVGPPCVRVAETGEDLSEEFFGMFALDPFALGDFESFMQQPHVKGPDYYPFSHRAYPLSGERAKVLGRSHDGDPAVVQATDRPNVIYDSSLDTLNPVTYGLMANAGGVGIGVHINNGYYRIFENVREPGCYLLLLVSGMRSGLDAHVTVGDDAFTLTGGTYVAFKIAAGKAVLDDIFTDGAHTE